MLLYFDGNVIEMTNLANVVDSLNIEVELDSTFEPLNEYQLTLHLIDAH